MMNRPSRRATRFRKPWTTLPTTMSSRRIPFVPAEKMRLPANINYSDLSLTPSGTCPSATKRITPGITGNPGWLTRTFRHIELAPIFTVASGQPVNPLTGLDSNLSHAFPLSSRPFGLGRNSLQNPFMAQHGFPRSEIFSVRRNRAPGRGRRIFQPLQPPNVLEINPVFGSGPPPRSPDNPRSHSKEWEREGWNFRWILSSQRRRLPACLPFRANENQNATG